MPVSITIRNVPAQVRDELASRAARSGRSLQEYLVALLSEQTSRPTVEDVVAGARRRVQSTKSDVTAEESLRALRDDRR